METEWARDRIIIQNHCINQHRPKPTLWWTENYAVLTCTHREDVSCSKHVLCNNECNVGLVLAKSIQYFILQLSDTHDLLVGLKLYALQAQLQLHVKLVDIQLWSRWFCWNFEKSSEHDWLVSMEICVKSPVVRIQCSDRKGTSVLASSWQSFVG